MITLKFPVQIGSWLRHGIPIAFLVLVILVAGYELRQLDFHAIRATLHALSPLSLLGVQLVAFLGVFAMGLYDWQAARTLRLPVGVSRLLRNAWIANSFNNVVGLSGMAGSGIRLLLLTTEQVKAPTAAAFAGLVMFSVPVGLSVLSWPLLLATLPGSEQLPVPRWVLLTALGAFALYLPVYNLVLHRGWLKRITGSLPALSRKTRVRDQLLLILAKTPL